MRSNIDDNLLKTMLILLSVLAMLIIYGVSCKGTFAQDAVRTSPTTPTQRNIEFAGNFGNKGFGFNNKFNGFSPFGFGGYGFNNGFNGFQFAPYQYYGFQDYSQGQNQTNGKLDQILEQLKSQDARLVTLERFMLGQSVPTPQPNPTPTPSPSDRVANLANTCNKCHGGENRRGGFSFVGMTSDKRQLATKRVAAGTMPPDSEPKLTETQKLSIIAELNN